MGSLKVSPWHLAKIFENHYNQSNGICPGTDVDLIALLKDVTHHDFVQFYHSTFTLSHTLSSLWKETFDQEEQNQLNANTVCC